MPVISVIKAQSLFHSDLTVVEWRPQHDQSLTAVTSLLSAHHLPFFDSLTIILPLSRNTRLPATHPRFTRELTDNLVLRALAKKVRESQSGAKSTKQEITVVSGIGLVSWRHSPTVRSQWKRDCALITVIYTV